MKNSCLLFIFFSVLSLQNLQAQRGFEVGAWAGGSWYLGDLNTEYDLSLPGAAGGLVGRFNFNHRISATGSLNYGRIRANDAKSNNSFQQLRNLNFYSDVFDAAAVIEFNFFPYLHGSATEYYTPYIFGGFNFFRFDPMTTLNGEKVSLREMGTEGQLPGQEYNFFSFGLAYGIGWKWDISRKWSLNIFVSSRSLFSDYIDDVSGVYPDYNQLMADRGADAVLLANRSEMEDFGSPGTQRGDATTNDSYHFIGLSIMRYFGRLNCPPISRIQGQ